MGTHDFISFPAKLLHISPRTWLLMGEAQATINAIKAMPLQPFDHEILTRIYLAKALHGTTAIEGNTLSELDVMRIMSGHANLDAAQRDDLLQIQNMNEAFIVVAQDIISGESQFSPELFNRYHRVILKGLADESVLGKIRAYNVEVGAYLAPPADDCELLLRQFCDWLNDDSVPSFEYAGYDLAWSVVKAVVAHVYFAWIHPYGDGNGRMARLIEQALLLRAGVPAVVAHVPSYFYSGTRGQYYAELQKTHGEFTDGAYPSSGDFCGFIEYALAGICNELGQLLSMSRDAQLRALYRDYIRGFFPEIMTAVQQRRMRLANLLAEHFAGTTLSMFDLMDLRDAGNLTDTNLSDNALDRDLEALIRMGLLTSEYDGYQANPEVLASFFRNSGIVAS